MEVFIMHGQKAASLKRLDLFIRLHNRDHFCLISMFTSFLHCKNGEHFLFANSNECLKASDFFLIIPIELIEFWRHIEIKSFQCLIRIIRIQIQWDRISFARNLNYLYKRRRCNKTPPRQRSTDPKPVCHFDPMMVFG